VPLLANAALTNAEELHGKVAVVRRGSGKFHDNARRVQEAGAVAMIMINTDDAPYVMRDPNKMGGDITIPMLCIGKADGERLLLYDMPFVTIGYNKTAFAAHGLVASAAQAERSASLLRIGGFSEGKNLKLRGLFTRDAKDADANGRPHWSTAEGGHLYYSTDGKWSLNGLPRIERFTPDKTDCHAHFKTAGAVPVGEAAWQYWDGSVWKEQKLTVEELMSTTTITGSRELCKLGDVWTYEGKAGALTMNPDSDNEVKLMWLSNGETSSYIKTAKLTRLVVARGSAVGEPMRSGGGGGAYQVGEQVERRDGRDSWGTGYVTSVNPLEVTSGSKTGKGYRWDGVRKMSGGGGGCGRVEEMRRLGGESFSDFERRKAAARKAEDARLGPCRVCGDPGRLSPGCPGCVHPGSR
jgi:hypothetical protein